MPKRLPSMRGFTTRPSGGNSLIPELHHHAGHHMVEVMAVERPSSRIIGVESDPGTAHRRNQNSVANGPLDRPAVDRDHLKRMPVQMHWMHHHRAIDQID